MDVLKPELVWIGKRCYRKNASQSPITADYHSISTDRQTAARHVGQIDSFDDDDGSCHETYHSTASDEIKKATDVDYDGTTYRLKMPVASGFHKFIIGRKGETKKQLENETQTQISVPRPSETGDVGVSGKDLAGVESCRTRIELIIYSARKRLPFTHFLSLPITSDVISQNYDEFKTEVLNLFAEERGIDSSIFQNRSRLHLTLGTLVLLSDQEIKRAAELLDSCYEQFIKEEVAQGPLIVDLVGLEYMNDDPRSVDVLYAKVAPTEQLCRLQMIADNVVSCLASSGLLQQEYDHVKLHMTVMNSLKRKDAGKDSAATKERLSFDASNILSHFDRYVFGRAKLTTLELSERHSTTTDGYYTAASSVSLS